jgi:hypothetical protein
MVRPLSRNRWIWAIIGVAVVGALLVSWARMAPVRPPPKKVYVAFFLGQGGYSLSWGIPYLAWRARKLGMETEIFPYTEIQKSWKSIVRAQAKGYKIALVGYSLGNSTATYLQRRLKIDLLLAVAQSSLAHNYRIDKRNTRRSVLWYGPDYLSNAGLKNGFDEVNFVDAPHLWMSVDARVTRNVLLELKELAGREPERSRRW